MLPFERLNNSRYGYDLEIRYEPFHVEFNLDEDAAKLPALFNSQHVDHVADFVLLCDPKGNMFQVYVLKVSGKAYFAQGWKKIGQFYGLQLGGWARLVYVRADRFLLNMKDRLDEEVIYPTPTTISFLGDAPKPLNGSTFQFIPHLFYTMCQKPDIFHVLHKTLSFADVFSGRLHIPHDYCEVAFRQTGIHIVLFDDLGIEVACSLKFRNGCAASCGIADGWNQFCMLRGLKPGQRVQLGVPSLQENR